jgi:hypothetical protein
MGDIKKNGRMALLDINRWKALDNFCLISFKVYQWMRVPIVVNTKM